MHWIALQPLPDATATPGELAERLTAWGWWALQFSPKVACVDLAAKALLATAQQQVLASQVLLLEVSASERLFGGRRALLAQMFKKSGPIFEYACAQAATS